MLGIMALPKPPVRMHLSLRAAKSAAATTADVVLVDTTHGFCASRLDGFCRGGGRMSDSGKVRWPVVMVTAVAASLTPPIAMAQEIDPRADEVLRAMSDYLAGLQTFSVTADASTEILMRNGAKMQLTATGDLVIDRALGFRVVRSGPAGQTTITFDGTRVGIANEALGAHLIIPAEGSIDAAIDEVRSVLGAEVTGGADLLYADPYEGLMLEVESGTYMGEVTVGGVHAHHLLYRAADIDWQLWVRSEGDPIPVKYVITSKWVTAAPSFSVQFNDFTPGVTTAPGDFVFTPPEGSEEIDPMAVQGLEIIGEG
jgi:hypothetical protein